MQQHAADEPVGRSDDGDAAIVVGSAPHTHARPGGPELTALNPDVGTVDSEGRKWSLSPLAVAAASSKARQSGTAEVDDSDVLPRVADDSLRADEGAAADLDEAIEGEVRRHRSNTVQRARSTRRRALLGAAAVLLIAGVVAIGVAATGGFGSSPRLPHTMAAEFTATTGSDDAGTHRTYTGSVHKTTLADGSWDISASVTLEVDGNRNEFTVKNSRAYVQSYDSETNEVVTAACITEFDVPPLADFADAFDSAAPGVSSAGGGASVGGHELQSRSCSASEAVYFVWAGRTYAFCDHTAAGVAVFILEAQGETIEFRHVQAGDSLEDVPNTIATPEVDGEPMVCPELDLQDFTTAAADAGADAAAVHAGRGRRTQARDDADAAEGPVYRCLFVKGVESAPDEDVVAAYTQVVASEGVYSPLPCASVEQVSYDSRAAFDAPAATAAVCDAIASDGSENLVQIVSFGTGGLTVGSALAGDGADGLCDADTVARVGHHTWLYDTNVPLGHDLTPEQACEGPLGRARGTYTSMCECPAYNGAGAADCTPTAALRRMLQWDADGRPSPYDDDAEADGADAAAGGRQRRRLATIKVHALIGAGCGFGFAPPSMVCGIHAAQAAVRRTRARHLQSQYPYATVGGVSSGHASSCSGYGLSQASLGGGYGGGYSQNYNAFNYGYQPENSALHSGYDPKRYRSFPPGVYTDPYYEFRRRMQEAPSDTGSQSSEQRTASAPLHVAAAIGARGALRTDGAPLWGSFDEFGSVPFVPARAVYVAGDDDPWTLSTSSRGLRSDSVSPDTAGIAASFGYGVRDPYGPVFYAISAGNYAMTRDI